MHLYPSGQRETCGPHFTLPIRCPDLASFGPRLARPSPLGHRTAAQATVFVPFSSINLDNAIESILNNAP